MTKMRPCGRQECDFQPTNRGPGSEPDVCVVVHGLHSGVGAALIAWFVVERHLHQDQRLDGYKHLCTNT